MLHQHGVQLAARATNRSQARRPRISPLFLAHSGDVLAPSPSKTTRPP